MIVRYLGHSSFFVTTAKGSSIILDPYGVNLRYAFPQLAADIVVISHEHQDHNASWRVGGNPWVVKRTSDFPVEHEVAIKRTSDKVLFYGIPTYHDKFAGRRRGPNTVWHWYDDGVHFCHLGDLGHLLTDAQLKQLDYVDVLFLPVGGCCTLEPTEAALVVNQLSPKLVFPMHYKTPMVDNTELCKEPLDSFLSRMDNIDMASTMAVDVDQGRLPRDTRIIVLNYD